MRRSFRSPLTRMLREALAVCREAESLGAPVDEITAIRAERAAGANRRRFLAGAALATAVSIMPRRSFAIGAPRVVIVGAGMAGLSCARKLWDQRRIVAQIYEWSDRVGGRLDTLRGYFANGQTVEQHGEFVSSEHAATLRLAHEFGLDLENVAAIPRGLESTYWFSGARYSQEDLNRDWHDFGYNLFRHAAQHAPVPNYRSHSRDAYAWDHMSVAEWIHRYVPGGLPGRFGALCYSAAINEYGGPPESQSALNLIYALGLDASTQSGHQAEAHPLLAGTDEKWHISGGNDRLVSGLAARLPQGTVRFGHRLVALRENADRSCTCTFEAGAATIETVADHVVLAIPFTILRHVDLNRVHFSARKRLAIDTLLLGNSAKIMIQVAARPWRNDNYTGSMLTDRMPENGWDGSSYQKTKIQGATEIYVQLPGGQQGAGLAKKYGIAFGHNKGPAPSALVTDSLAALEPIFPGVTAAWNAGPQLAWVSDGNIDQRLLGAWTQYNVGQYTGFSGIEPEREGNIHFAGEHTSIEFQGFIEGALRSGERAANEI